MNDHITREQFLLEFFGMFGREIGNPPKQPARKFTDNPRDIFELIRISTEEHLPAFITVQPFREYDVVLGFEKLFYDFDYGKKSQKLTQKQIEKRLEACKVEVRQFVYHLSKFGIQPLVVKTRKGYHVYIYFDSVYEIVYSNKEEEDFWKEVYKRIRKKYMPKKYEYCDTSSESDIKRFCRVPMSIHEKSGEECIIVDKNLKKDKIRSLNFYKTYGLKSEEIKKEIITTRMALLKKKEEEAKRRLETKQNWETKHGFIGEIRQCFIERIKLGEMCHQQRLALLLEAWYSGKRIREELIDIFRSLHDFNNMTVIQVDWFLEHKVYEEFKPYTCDTISGYGWCLGEKCEIWRKRHGK